VRLYARRPEVRERLSGAEIVDRVGDIGTSDVVVSCLYSDTQMLEVLPEVVEAMESHTVLVSHTTGSPATLDRLGTTAVVDAPFSGTADAVRAGQLTVYLGGEQSYVDIAREVVSAYADPIILTGPQGSALRVKLLNNLLFAAISQVTLRGLAAGRALGIDENALLEALAVSSGGSTAGRYIAARGGTDPYIATVTPFLRKDLAAVAGLDVDVSELLATAHDGPMTLRENGVVR